MKNYYRILNVRTNATDAEIKAAYRTLAKRYHPDVNPNDTAAAKRFADVNEAYSVLSDAAARNEYDQLLWQATATRKTGGTAQGAQSTQQMQFDAQVQAQVQAQLLGVRDRAYKEGYARGSKDGQAYATKTLRAETEKARKELNDSKNERRSLEQELFDRDRDLAQANEQLRDLRAQAEWLRKAAGQAGDPMHASIKRAKSRAIELQKAIARIQIKPTAIETPATAALHDEQKKLQTKFVILHKTITALEEETVRLYAQNERQNKVLENQKLVSALEAQATEWAKKDKADRRAAKNTLYGTLGVLPWATEREIDESFDRLSARYENKADAESAQKLQALKDAYSVLMDAKRRKEYDGKIGLTDERIDKERKLAAQNLKVQEEYRKKTENFVFWKQFDELSALALSGDADAQNALGELYYSGEKIGRDYGQAVYWFREAVASRHPVAMYRLGVCYLNGEGVRRNKTVGEAYLRQAELRGYTQHTL